MAIWADASEAGTGAAASVVAATGGAARKVAERLAGAVTGVCEVTEVAAMVVAT